MAQKIPNLWPEDIKPDILTPLAILRTQVNALGHTTKGLLEARLDTSADDDTIVYRLFAVAPALNYEHTILQVLHSRDLVYPATIEARVEKLQDVRREANSDDEFMRILEYVLASAYVRAVISSLIARSNEQSTGANSSVG